MIVLEHLSKSYAGREGPVEVLQNISLRIPPGSYTALVGASGSGKSTLMHILGCLDTPTSGRYLLDGEDVSGLKQAQLCRIRREKIGFVFQGYQLMSRLNALENVAFPLLLRGVGEEERLQAANLALGHVGLGGRERHLPSQLSGGQQQRVALARALCARPKLLLCDEPTGALDVDSRNEILDLLDALHADGHTIVLITHDPFVASRAHSRYRVAQGSVKPVIPGASAAYPC